MKQTVEDKTDFDLSKLDHSRKRDYHDVTNERLKKLYPTKDWPYRYRRAVWGGR